MGSTWEQHFPPSDGWVVPNEFIKLFEFGVLIDGNHAGEYTPVFRFASAATDQFELVVDHPDETRRRGGSGVPHFALLYHPACDRTTDEICTTDELDEILHEIRTLEQKFREPPVHARLDQKDVYIYENEDCWGCGHAFWLDLDQVVSERMQNIRCPYCGDLVVTATHRQDAIEAAAALRRAEQQP